MKSGSISKASLRISNPNNSLGTSTIEPLNVKFFVQDTNLSPHEIDNQEMVSWALINTIGFPVGLWLFRNGFRYYKALRVYKRTTPIRPLPPQVSWALNMLFVAALIALISTTYPTPPNIFRATEGRLQTANEVIFNRLSALRPLTTLDMALKPKLASKETRLFYFAFGPNVIAECPFCAPDDPTSYLYYALPSILGPHLLHIAVLGLVTSSFFSDREGARWRTHATIAGVVLAVIELYFIATYDIRYNTRSTQTSNIDFFFWRMRLYRGLAIAAVDGLLGWIIWLAASNRLFTNPPDAMQRLETLAQVVDASNFRLWAAGNVRNTIARDEELREKVARYWAEEKGLYEEREVVDAIREALTRLNIQQLADVAEQRAGDVVRAMQVQQVRSSEGS